MFVLLRYDGFELTNQLLLELERLLHFKDMQLKQKKFRCNVHCILSTSLFTWIFTAMFGSSSMIALVVGWSPRCLHRIRRNIEPKTLNNFCGAAKGVSHRFGTVKTFRSERAKNAEEVDTIQYANVFCADDLSVRALSSFGGIQYVNTDVDSRFRVLFVLGGPGESNQR